MTAELRCILFDLYETLVTFDNAAVRTARQRVLEPFGVSADAFEQAERELLGERMLGRCGDTLVEEMTTVLRRAGAPTDPTWVQSYTRAELTAWRSATIVYDDVMPCLWMLRCGFSLGLISNCVGLTPALLPHWPFGDLFSFTVLSCETGHLKPTREIFDVAIERAGCAPNEMALVDDKRGNVEAALAMGMHGSQIVREGSREQHPDALVDLRDLVWGWPKLVAQARQR